MEKKQKKEDKKKQLHIELKGDIREIVDEYMQEAGSDPHSIAFSMGFLSGRTNDGKEPMSHLMHLLQAYFFAGVFYSRTREFGYDYLSPEDRQRKSDAKVQEFMKEQEKKKADMRPKEKTTRANYIG